MEIDKDDDHVYEAFLFCYEDEIVRNRAPLNERVKELEKEYDQLLLTFRHVHRNNGEDDTCAQCELDLRHPIHLGLTDGEPWRQ